MPVHRKWFPCLLIDGFLVSHGTSSLCLKLVIVVLSAFMNFFPVRAILTHIEFVSLASRIMTSSGDSRLAWASYNLSVSAYVVEFATVSLSLSVII